MEEKKKKGRRGQVSSHHISKHPVPPIHSMFPEQAGLGQAGMGRHGAGRRKSTAGRWEVRKGGRGRGHGRS